MSIHGISLELYRMISQTDCQVDVSLAQYSQSLRLLHNCLKVCVYRGIEPPNAISLGDGFPNEELYLERVGRLGHSETKNDLMNFYLQLGALLQLERIVSLRNKVSPDERFNHRELLNRHVLKRVISSMVVFAQSFEGQDIGYLAEEFEVVCASLKKSLSLPQA